jgi:hypothetical protein
MILDLTECMAEAIRLTRGGQLAEARALLLGGPPNPESLEVSEGLDRESMRTAFPGRQLIDMVPRRSGSGQWTAPVVDAQHRAAALV